MGLWAVCTMHSATPRPHLERYHLIEKGMTRSDVETILGAPSGDYSTVQVVRTWGRVFILPGEVMLEWTTEELCVMVFFDVQGRVTRTDCSPVTPCIPSSSGLRGLWMRLISWCTNRKPLRQPTVDGGID
jgi:hypothetical protein